MEMNDAQIIGTYRDDAQLLHQYLAGAGAQDLRRRSQGTRWTNEQLLFHMVFGYMVVRALIPLMHLLMRCPTVVRTTFARILNFGTALFHPINYAGSCAAALVFNHRRMERKLLVTLDALERSLERESAETLRRRTDFPDRWDPYFHRQMTLLEVYAYPSLHFAFHARQLSLNA